MPRATSGVGSGSGLTGRPLPASPRGPMAAASRMAAVVAAVQQQQQQQQQQQSTTSSQQSTPRKQVPLATPRLEKLAVPKRVGGTPEQIQHRVFNERRLQAEAEVLLREMALADAQLDARQAAQQDQADAFREQIDELRAQMRSGSSTGMAAAAMAAEELAACNAEAARYRDVIAKLRAQVATLRADKERLEQGASASSVPPSKTAAHQAMVDEAAAKEAATEHTRLHRQLASLEAEKQRLTNANATLRTERNRAREEAAAAREEARSTGEQLEAARAAEKAADEATCAEVEAYRAAAAAAAAAHLAALDEVRSRLDEQRKINAALMMPVISMMPVSAPAPAPAGALEVNVGDGSDEGGGEEATTEGGGGSGPSELLDTVRLLREQVLSHEQVEAALGAERDQAVEREELVKEKLRKVQAQCKHLQAQLAERTRQLQLHASGATENDAASPNVPRGVPMRGLGPGGLGPGSVEVEERDGREADVMRRTLEATRVQLRTQQAERMRCERELRLLRSKVDGLKAAGDAAAAAKGVAEEQLDVQKVAAQAMMQRLQARAAECTALQRQLAARAVELVHAREEKQKLVSALEAQRAVLATEIHAMETWIFGHKGFMLALGGLPPPLSANSSARSTPRVSVAPGPPSGGFGGAASQRGSGGGLFTDRSKRDQQQREGSGEDSTPRGAGRGGGGGGGGGGVGLNQEAFMAKELMQCRHELEGCRRVCAEYAERTHAAEKAAARAATAMNESHLEHARVQAAYERVLAEVQIQRNRVAKLRLAASRRGDASPGRSGQLGGEYEDESVAASAPGSPREAGRPAGQTSWSASGGGSVLRLEDGTLRQPEWNSSGLPPPRPPRDERTGLRVASYGAKDRSPSHEAAPPAGQSGGGSGGSSGTMLLLPGGEAPGTPRGEASRAEVLREVASLQHQLSTLRGEKAMADKAAAERQQQCVVLASRVAEANQQRDEQAEQAQGRAAEAELLRKQLLAARTASRSAVEGVEDSRRLLAAASRDALLNHHATVATLTAELRALEGSLATHSPRGEPRARASSTGGGARRPPSGAPLDVRSGSAPRREHRS